MSLAPSIDLPPVEDGRAYEVAWRRPQTRSIVEVALRPAGEPLAFMPGQYVLIDDPRGRVPQRSYSIANAPRPDGVLTLLVTREACGATSTWIHGLAPGERVAVGGPYGSFLASDECAAPRLYLAAGSGLAPVRALIEAAVARTPRRAQTLLFSARAEADVIDRDRFERLAAECPGFRFIRTLTGEAGPPPTGRIPAVLHELCGDLGGHQVFIAGSEGFVRDSAAAALAAGARPDNVHVEAFSAREAPAYLGDRERRAG